jgi:uncharacterized protein YdhG (YjbR/CyaY superfamily)
MPPAKSSPANIDAYIAGFPAEVQAILQRIRTTIQKAVPKAQEAIKYDMPSFVLEGNLVHFAAFKKHIGFFGGSTDGGRLSAETAPYEGPKGSLRFPFDQPVPYGLIRKITQAKAKEHRAKAAAKRKK